MFLCIYLSGSNNKTCIVIITDGIHGNLQSAAAEVYKAGRYNVTYFTVGVGAAADQVILSNLTSLPFNKHGISVDSFNLLKEARSDLVDLCKVILSSMIKNDCVVS